MIYDNEHEIPLDGSIAKNIAAHLTKLEDLEGKTLLLTEEETTILDGLFNLMWPALIAEWIWGEMKGEELNEARFSVEVSFPDGTNPVLTFRRQLPSERTENGNC